MAKKKDRIVSPTGDGKWKNLRLGAAKASSVHTTQAEAIEAAREMLHNQGGGELSVQGKDGKIRAKDTIAPGNDPYPPPG